MVRGGACCMMSVNVFVCAGSKRQDLIDVTVQVHVLESVWEFIVVAKDKNRRLCSSFRMWGRRESEDPSMS